MTSAASESTAAPTRPERPTLRDAMLGAHSKIEVLISRLEDQAEADVRPDLERTWAELERALLMHLDEEEMFLFPVLGESNPEERDALAREHGEIRRLLGEIGIGIELHAIRLPAVTDLAQRLRTHAAREDRLLYTLWEGADLTGPKTLLARITRRLLPIA